MAERFYEVRVAQSVDKDIQALPSEIRKRIEDAIQELASNPFPSGCKKLQEERNRFSGAGRKVSHHLQRHLPSAKADSLPLR